jgi:hypothetical protein
MVAVSQRPVNDHLSGRTPPAARLKRAPIDAPVRRSSRAQNPAASMVLPHCNRCADAAAPGRRPKIVGYGGGDVQTLLLA